MPQASNKARSARSRFSLQPFTIRRLPQLLRLLDMQNACATEGRVLLKDSLDSAAGDLIGW